MLRGLRALWIYPIAFIVLLTALFVREKTLPPDPGRGLGDAWLAFFGVFTVAGYGIGVQACWSRLRNAPAKRVTATALLVVPLAPILWFGAWSLASHVLWMRTPWWFADLMFFFGPAIAGVISVPMSLVLSRPITSLGAPRPAA